MDKKEKLLTIGQFAAMHGINKKTLMWYDEIGLLKPAVLHPENGYRCYNYHQSPILETILLLRELDVSIPEIQEFMKNRSAANLKELLDERIAALDKHIHHLYAVRENLCTHRENMLTLLHMDLSEISIVQREARFLITAEINAETSFEKEVELITQKTKKYQLGRLHDASYGSMIPVASLQNGDFSNYTKLFVEFPVSVLQSGRQVNGKPEASLQETTLQDDAGADRVPETVRNQNTPTDISPKNQKGAGRMPNTKAQTRGAQPDTPSPESDLHIQPGGKYIRAFHKGAWEQIPARYAQILDYAKAHGLVLHGFSYERGINENVIDHIEDYIVQIEIPVAEHDPKAV